MTDHDDYSEVIARESLAFTADLGRQLNIIHGYVALDPECHVVTVARTLEIAQGITNEAWQYMNEAAPAIVWTDEAIVEDGPAAVWFGQVAGRSRVWRIMRTPLAGFHGVLS